MEPVLVVVMIVAVLAAWAWFVNPGQDPRKRSPLWFAFTATAASLLYLIAGAAGYELEHGVPFTIGSAWSGTVIWSQIWIGAGLSLIACYLWRQGLRSIRSSLQTSIDR